MAFDVNSSAWFIDEGGGLFLGLFFGIVFILALSLCACVEKESSTSGDITVEVKRKSKHRKSQNGDIEHVTIELRNGDVRHSNGTVSGDSGDRPKSHDQRALPEIPATSVVSTSQTEDEEEDDGTYDIIPKKRTKVNNAPVQPVVVALESPGNLYEAVDGEVETPDSEGRPEHVRNHPYAVVGAGASSPLYTVIDEAKKITPKYDRVKNLGIAPKASSETLEDGTLMAANQAGLEQNLNDEESPSASRLSSNVENIPTAGTVATAIQAFDSGAQADSQVPDDAAPAKKEPPYSRVTARESLANMRERQALEQQSASTRDPNYDTVNYAVIGESTASSIPFNRILSADQGSLASDVYAEIQGSGANSARSSTYAKVNEDGINSTPSHSISAEVLRQKFSNNPDADASDPGYSIVRTRPLSANISRDTEEGGVLYAVVNKSQKNRGRSIHVSNRVAESLPQGIIAPSGDIYAEVNKQTNQVQHKLVSRRNNSSDKTGDPGYQTIGSLGKEDPDYDNIEDTPAGTGRSMVEYEDVDGVRDALDSIDGSTITGEGMVHIGDHKVQEDFWKPREHVYQEISEAQMEKENLGKNNHKKHQSTSL